jgi:hypothetical protein
VPIGIHSLVNGVALEGESVDDDGALEAFVHSLGELNLGLTRLFDYGRDLIRNRCEDLGIVDGPLVTVGTYVRACDAGGLTRDSSWDDFHAHLAEAGRRGAQG